MYKGADSLSENEHLILFYSWKDDTKPRPSLEQMLQDRSEESSIYNLLSVQHQWQVISFVQRNLEILPGLPAIGVQRWKRRVLAGVSGLQVELRRRAAAQSPEHLWEVHPAGGQQRGQCGWQLPRLSPEEAQKKKMAFLCDRVVRACMCWVLEPFKFWKITKAKLEFLLRKLRMCMIEPG